jgi:hypothetical protein
MILYFINQILFDLQNDRQFITVKDEKAAKSTTEQENKYLGGAKNTLFFLLYRS